MSIQTFFTKEFLFSFKGRATRSEWWGLQFFALLIVIAGVIVRDCLSSDPLHPPAIILLSSMAVNVIALWIGITGTIKRFHDRGKSGWNCLWQFLPVLGTIYVLYACGITENGHLPNAYGLPRGVLTQTVI